MEEYDNFDSVNDHDDGDKSEKRFSSRFPITRRAVVVRVISEWVLFCTVLKVK